MNEAEYNEAMTSWIDERISIMAAEGMAEDEAAERAKGLWQAYRRYHKLFMNEQGAI